MKIKLLILSTLILLLTVTQFVYSQEVQTKSKPCGNPAAPCSHHNWKFKANDLTFKLPQTLKWQTNYYSANFYAIILKSRKAIPGEDVDSKCGGFFSESERAKAQSKFADNKVFASRFRCGVLGIGYSNVNYDYNILAVYAGETEDEAKNFLKIAMSKGYADANIRKMQIVLSYGD